nr:type I-E CRISPR-associated protein Cse2/CasB [Oecophyllibacter saccharovorans]
MTPSFWHLWNDLQLARYCPFPLSENERQDRWQRVFQAYAKFLPTGSARAERQLPHDSKTRLGRVLRGAGERPRVSEARIARLLSAPEEKRPALMMRLLPFLKNEKFDFVELGEFLLNPNEEACRKVAKQYYR